MKRRLLLVGGFCLTLSVSAFAQQNTAQHQLPAAIENISTLSTHVTKINEKQTQLVQAQNSSRGQFAQLKQELVSLLETYNGLLKQEFATSTSDEVKNALSMEMKFVADQSAQLSTPNQR